MIVTVSWVIEFELSPSSASGPSITPKVKSRPARGIDCANDATVGNTTSATTNQKILRFTLTVLMPNYDFCPCDLTVRPRLHIIYTCRNIRNVDSRFGPVRHTIFDRTTGRIDDLNRHHRLRSNHRNNLRGRIWKCGDRKIEWRFLRSDHHMP